MTIPKSNKLAKRPTKDIEQLLTLSRTVSLDLQGLQDDVVNTIKPISVHYSILEPLNALNTALYANEISAKPSADLILLEGLKQARCQVHAVVLVNLFILSGY